MSGSAVPKKNTKKHQIKCLQKVTEGSKSRTLIDEVLGKHKNLTYLKKYIYILCVITGKQ